MNQELIEIVQENSNVTVISLTTEGEWYFQVPCDNGKISGKDIAETLTRDEFITKYISETKSKKKGG